MKPSTIVVLGVLVCAILLFVSATATAEESAQDIKPKGGTEYGAELAKGRCIHGCCSRRKIIRTCVVCCASAEEAKAFAAAQTMKDGMGRRGGTSTAEAKAEAKP